MEALTIHTAEVESQKTEWIHHLFWVRTNMSEKSYGKISDSKGNMD